MCKSHLNRSRRSMIGFKSQPRPRKENKTYQIDGVEVNSLAWGGAAVITPNQESVKEITVESNPYDAENGRNSGAQVLTVSKNGTNEFHGSAMMQGQRPGLNAY